MNEKVLISDINLDVTPVLPLLVGSDTILNYSVLPGNASDKGVIWKSGSPEIASVDEEGRIKGCTCRNSNYLSNACCRFCGYFYC